MVPYYCPTCGSDDVHHSRPRSFGEKLRFNLTGWAPFRCYACGWRDWLPDRSEAADPVRKVHAPPAESALDDLNLHANDDNDPASVVGDLMPENHEQREQKKRGA
jgi:hypothetical protein